MKKNNKGFALAEILAVTLVMMAIFAVLYGNFMPLAGEYDKSVSYNDVASQYTIHYFRKLYMNNVTLNNNEEYRILNCSESKNQNKCNELLELNKYVEPDNPETELSPKILLTRYNLTNLKTITSGEYENIPEALREFSTYINNLPNYKDKDTEEETYRLIIKTQTGYANTELNGIKIETPGTNAVQLLKSKVGRDGLQQVNHSADSTLQITQAITEYRYRGVNTSVNNYIYFNCSDLNNQSDSTCEIWRIIGVFPTDDGTGNIRERIKILKTTSIGETSWNSCSYTSTTSGEVCNDTGKKLNDWPTATLNTYLNSTYYNSISTSSKNLIGNAKYYLGGVSYHSTGYGYFSAEKKNEANRSQYFSEGNQISHTNKIGLMNVSDYAYAGLNETEYIYDLGSYTSTNWIFSGVNEWLLGQYTTSGSVVNCILAGGYAGWDFAGNSGQTRPVLYLKPEVKIVDGNGTTNSKYQLGL